MHTYKNALIYVFFVFTAHDYQEADCKKVIDSLKKCCEKFSSSSECCAGIKVDKPT